MEAPVAVRTKKYVAPTLRQALDEMRRELGEDALLLSTHSGIDLDGTPYAEVVGMASGAPLPQPATVVDAAGAPTFAPPRRRTSPREPIPLHHYIESSPAQSNNAINNLQLEIHRLSAKLTEVAHAVAYRYSPILPAPYRQMYEMLRQAGFAENHAGFLIARVANSNQPINSLEECLDQLRHVLGSLIKFHKLITDSLPPLVGFAGPSGSGKTTTLMKSALLLQRTFPHLTIRLLSADIERIGATEQLRSFAALCKFEFDILRDADRITAISGANDAITFIDFPPSSTRTEPMIASLGTAIEQAGGVVCFLVPASSDAEIMRVQLSRYIDRSAYRFVLTKLDEAPRCGHLLPLFWETNAPLSLVTTGTRLSDDLVEPSLDHLFRFLFSQRNLAMLTTM